MSGHKIKISDDDLLTILEMRDSIYYTTFKQTMAPFQLKQLCIYTYYIVTDKNYNTKENLEKFCKRCGLTYDSMVNFLLSYGITIKKE